MLDPYGSKAVDHARPATSREPPAGLSEAVATQPRALERAVRVLDEQR